MIQLEFTTLTSAVVVVTMLTLIIGYIRAIAGQHTPAVFHLAMSICLTLMAYVLRTVYWDVFPVTARLFNHLTINPVFDGIAIWGGIHGHLAIHAMIPIEDRGRWSLFTAWAYPPFYHRINLRKFLKWLFFCRF